MIVSNIPIRMMLKTLSCVCMSLLWRPMLAKPELLVFCGLESGVARQPRNLGFVLALSCRSLLRFKLWEVDQRGFNVFCGCAERGRLRDITESELVAGLGLDGSVLRLARSLSCHAPNEEDDIGNRRCQRKPCARQFVFSIEVHVEV